MPEEFPKHVDNCRGSGWRHALPVAPGVDFLDQFGLDPDVDVCCFPFHGGGGRALSGTPLDKSRQKIDTRSLIADRRPWWRQWLCLPIMQSERSADGGRRAK